LFTKDDEDVVYVVTFFC